MNNLDNVQCPLWECEYFQTRDKKSHTALLLYGTDLIACPRLGNANLQNGLISEKAKSDQELKVDFISKGK